jgi:CheY-like chemotaxis protein
LKNQGIASEIHISNNADEALDFLSSGEDNNDGNLYPDLILLDLNVLEMGGK